MARLTDCTASSGLSARQADSESRIPGKCYREIGTKIGDDERILLVPYDLLDDNTDMEMYGLQKDARTC